MAKARAHPDHLESSRALRLAVSEELRRWIDQVIVPILVVQYLHEKGLKEEKIDG